MHRVITSRFLQCLTAIEYGSFTVVTPDGVSHVYHGTEAGASGTLIIHDWGVITSLLMRGDIGFAEDYRDGLWDSPDLTALLLVSLQNTEVLQRYIYGSIMARAFARLSYLFTQNTMKGSRKNIHAHYDLGNGFYKLWLDPTMTYSAACFSSDDESLVQAQYNKYDRIINRLGDKTGSLIEVGCGWGGFADRALERQDYGIKGVTISDEQHAFAQERLKGRADIALEDYRLQEGRYDYLVSIEMFEAVGERFWPGYFQKVRELLKEKGKAVIQTITIRDEFFESYRSGGDFIRTYIFPGGMLPSRERFERQAEKSGLQVTDCYEFDVDYATTLDRWLESFNAQADAIKRQGFDERFMRLWRFYLASCSASFRCGRTGVMQVELQHA